MSHKSLAIAATLLFAQGFAHAAVGPSDNWFATHFQSSKVACYEAKTHITYTMSSTSKGIEVTARGEARGARYNVDHSSITDSQLKVTVVNNLDGPLSQDVLIFALSDLTQLGTKISPKIMALDFFSEGFDGTSSKSQLSCSLE